MHVSPEYSLFYRALLQKRPVILRSLYMHFIDMHSKHMRSRIIQTIGRVMHMNMSVSHIQMCDETHRNASCYAGAWILSRISISMCICKYVCVYVSHICVTHTCHTYKRAMRLIGMRHVTQVYKSWHPHEYVFVTHINRWWASSLDNKVHTPACHGAFLWGGYDK